MLNRFKTAALLGLLTALFLFIGNTLGGTLGLVIAVILALVLNYGSYWFSDGLVLRMHRAQQIKETGSSELFEIVVQLSKRVENLMPKLCVIPVSTQDAIKPDEPARTLRLLSPSNCSNLQNVTNTLEFWESSLNTTRTAIPHYFRQSFNFTRLMSSAVPER